MHRLGMHDMRWHQENWGAEGRRRQMNPKKYQKKRSSISRSRFR